MAEVLEEAPYIRHHKKKIAFIFSPRETLRPRICKSEVWRVDYVPLDGHGNSNSPTAR
jgi:deoxyribodipyrimidine photolyase-related protein